MILKEYQQTFRDKRMVMLLTAAPVVQLILLGYAVNMEVDRVPTVIADEDRSPQSRSLAKELTAGDAFTLVGQVPSGEEAVKMVSRGEVAIALVIPRGYAERLRAGKTARLQALVDGGDSNRATVAQNALAAFVMQRASGLALERAKTLAASQGRALDIPLLVVEPRILYNPTLSSKIYFVPGVAATLLLILTLITTAMGLAREKEMGTLEQVLVTPIRPEILILGKTLPYYLFGVVDLGLVIVAGAWIFEVPIRGSIPLLFLAGTLYMLTTLGVGLLVSAIARTQQQAFFGAIFFVMPAILLSGFITPVENMPDWLQPLSGLSPVRHFVEIMRAVLLKDASMGELASPLVALGGLGLTVYASAAYLLRRRLA
ncbi:MAG: ABC transporter permease [Polyangia bacterium]|jgi:ABC-2 type transport system permease protein|nr:ABC transporter permease [Polyangia bacterium]